MLPNHSNKKVNGIQKCDFTGGIIATIQKLSSKTSLHKYPPYFTLFDLVSDSHNPIPSRSKDPGQLSLILKVIAGDILHILSNPLVQASLELLITDVGGSNGKLAVPLPVEAASGATGNTAKVVRVIIELETERAGVAADAGVARADLDLADGGRGDLEPPFGRGVAVVGDDGRETGHGVLVVGDAVLLAGLGGGEGGKGLVADAGRAKGVQVGRVAALAEVGGRECGDGAAERVAGHTDAVGWVGGLGRLDGRGDGGRDFLPGSVEAGVDEAAAHKVAAGGLGEDDAGWIVSIEWSCCDMPCEGLVFRLTW